LIGSSNAIYIISPNVRLETMDKGSTGRHLLEFTQVDFEIKGSTAKQALHFIEELLGRILSRVNSDCAEELAIFGRSLGIPKMPFSIYDSSDLQKEFGFDWEHIISSRSTGPVWAMNHEREFYDKEDPEKPLTYLNYDLIYPEGFGEALSGAEREHEYERILERMHRKKMDLEPYNAYLEVARAGLLHPSAGAGFGVERLVRYICGVKRIEDVSPFGKVPGGKFVF
ncbi:MAG: asparagine synthetase A, partial [Candidatus Micrarchaeota archaeon]